MSAMARQRRESRRSRGIVACAGWLLLSTACSTPPPTPGGTADEAPASDLPAQEVRLSPDPGPEPAPTPPLEPTRFTLTEVRARILENNNLTLAAETLRIAEAEGREREAGLWPNPYVLLRKRRIDGFDITDTGFLELEVGQTFELGGKRAARTDLARAQAEVVGEEVRALTASTLRDAERKFYALLRLELDHAQALEAARVAGELEQLAAGRVDAGKESRIAQLRFEAAATDARLTAQSLERKRERACRELDELLGAPVGLVAGVEGELDAGELTAFDRTSAWHMLLSHPRLRAAEKSAAAAQHAIDSAEADTWPDLIFAVAYEHDSNLDRDYAGLLLKLPLPIWDRNQGRRAEARAALRRARKSLEAEAQTLAVELSTAWLDYEQAQADLSGYDEEILPRLEESFALTQSAFDAGRISYFEVLDAHLALIRARRTRLDHLEERAKAAAQIRYLTGSWEED